MTISKPIQVTASLDQLNSDQKKALKAYALEKGAKWKQRLIEDWIDANATILGRHSPELQQIRNKLGSLWLMNLELDSTDIF